MRTHPPRFPVLVGDVGATNARFGVMTDSSSLTDIHSLKTSDFSTIEDSILSFGEREQFGSVLLAVAAPVIGSTINFTNCPWTISPEIFLERLGCTDLTLFNDFLAQALALPFLDDASVTLIDDSPSPSSDESNTMVVLGPGTGLGVSALLRSDDRWTPIGGEGGHASFGALTPDDTPLWSQLSELYKPVPLSAEMIMSGPAIHKLYCAVCAMNSATPTHATPEAITSAALSGDCAHSATTLGILCNLLGRFAGDLALTLLADRVYISGGIAPKILPFFSDFRTHFESKPPHNDFLRTIPSWVITSPTNALDGLGWYVRSPDKFELRQHTWHN